MDGQDHDTKPLVEILGLSSNLRRLWETTASDAGFDVVAAASADELRSPDATRPGVLLADSNAPFPCPSNAEVSSAVIAVLIGEERASPWYAVAWDAIERRPPAEQIIALLRAGIDESQARLDERAMVIDFHDRRATLSEKEDAVLIAVCNGRLNKQIARDLNVSVRTIEQRRRRLFEKMGVESAVPLAKLAAVVATLEDKERRVRRRADPPQTEPLRMTAGLKIAPPISTSGASFGGVPSAFV